MPRMSKNCIEFLKFAFGLGFWFLKKGFLLQVYYIAEKFHIWLHKKYIKLTSILYNATMMNIGDVYNTSTCNMKYFPAKKGGEVYKWMNQDEINSTSWRKDPTWNDSLCHYNDNH